MASKGLWSQGLRELRFVFCQTSGRSQGTRDYVAKNYFNLKKANPDFPFIVRECEEADPIIIARYRYGIEKKAHTANLSDKEVERVVQTLVNQSEEVNKHLQK